MALPTIENNHGCTTTQLYEDVLYNFLKFLLHLYQDDDNSAFSLLMDLLIGSDVDWELEGKYEMVCRAFPMMAARIYSCLADMEPKHLRHMKFLQRGLEALETECLSVCEYFPMCTTTCVMEALTKAKHNVEKSLKAPYHHSVDGHEMYFLHNNRHIISLHDVKELQQTRT